MGDARRVSEDLRILLSDDGDAATGAYERLENAAEAQGELFQCAPSVVSVIVAAITEGSIPPSNLPSALDVLGRIIAGHAARSEVEIGNHDLREQCHSEAMKGYWSLLRVALERDSFNAWQVARDVLVVLDKQHSTRVLL